MVKLGVDAISGAPGPQHAERDDSAVADRSPSRSHVHGVDIEAIHPVREPHARQLTQRERDELTNLDFGRHSGLLVVAAIGRS